MIGDAIGQPNDYLAIEDLFPEDFYIEKVLEAYRAQLAAAGITSLALVGNDGLANKVERVFEGAGLKYNKGTVAKRIRSAMGKMKSVDELPLGTLAKAEALLSRIRQGLPD
jgi:hypothetical protein